MARQNGLVCTQLLLEPMCGETDGQRSAFAKIVFLSLQKIHLSVTFTRSTLAQISDIKNRDRLTIHRSVVQQAGCRNLSG